MTALALAPYQQEARNMTIRKLTDSEDRTKNCLRCFYFRSLRNSLSVDEREPEKCGGCFINRDVEGHAEFVSDKHTCEKFSPSY